VTEESVKVVLIVDGDLGFVMWLGHALVDAGFQALPATSAEGAMYVLEKMRIAHVDVLIIDPDLPGSRHLREWLAGSGPVKLITIGTSEPAAEAMIERPPQGAPPSPHDYVDTVRRVIDNGGQ
jgi:DNA-binding response OmpR family regulator